MRAEQVPVTKFVGVGGHLAARLEKLGLKSAQDVLFHLPLRYEDRSRVHAIGGLQAGVSGSVEGEVELAEVVFRGRRSLLVKIADGTGSLTLRFFHFSRQQQESFQRGVRLRCFGEARRGRAGLEMVHPEYRLLREGDSAPAAEHLVPVYPATEGVQQGRLRALTTQALNQLNAGKLEVAELLPADAIPGAQFPTLADALRYVHRPPLDADLAQLAEGRHPAQRRLVFEELLAHHLSLQQLRQQVRRLGAPHMRGTGELVQAFLASLPFELTRAQQRVLDEILADLGKPQPMLRLVQGDVGSGKTAVAALAALRAVEAGYQAAVMAPTELLAEQHFRNFLEWLEPIGVRVAWLAGKLTAKQKREQLEEIESGKAQVVVGTHALFQESVTFRRLGLVVIDEQHRFGVHQRLALRNKGATSTQAPHQLIMTATPIPRTLAMTAYADLDTSVIDELPPGRTPVQTVVIPDSRRADVVERVNGALSEGLQVYWVCPLIEESDVLQYEAAENTFAALTEALPGRSIGLVHGRMKAAEKEHVMQAFERNRIGLLVATTVIEVGVNVPNASLMVVENAERMGLAQLHQLRGRVGRGSRASSCVLMYKAPLSQLAKKRLAVMRETNDGFVIAQEDLKLRGPGEVLGTKQTGLAQLHIADLVRDADMLPHVHKVAMRVMNDHPGNVQPLIDRWLGDAAGYANA